MSARATCLFGVVDRAVVAVVGEDSGRCRGQDDAERHRVEAPRGVANNPAAEQLADAIRVEIDDAKQRQNQERNQLQRKKDARDPGVRADPQQGDCPGCQADDGPRDPRIHGDDVRDVLGGAQRDDGRNGGGRRNHQRKHRHAQRPTRPGPRSLERMPDEGVVATGDREGCRQLGPAEGHEHPDDPGEQHREECAGPRRDDGERDDDEHGRRRCDAGQNDDDVAQDAEFAAEFLDIPRGDRLGGLLTHDRALLSGGRLLAILRRPPDLA